MKVVNFVQNFTEGCSPFWKIILQMAMPVTVVEWPLKHTRTLRTESMVILHIGEDIQLLIRSYSCRPNVCRPVYTFFFQVLTYLLFYYKLFFFVP